jgi:hypothetical protein
MDRTLPYPFRPPAVSLLYTVEGLASIGGNLIQVGIFFYTNRRFGWGARENLTLAAVQGVVYVCGALLAHGVSSRVAPRKVLSTVYLLLAAIALSTLLTSSVHAMIAAVLAYTALIAVTWPVLESLVSTGLDAHALSRRISVYNVVWAGTGAATLAVNGAIIDYWPAGVFVITAVVHGLSALLLLLPRNTPLHGGGGETVEGAGIPSSSHAHAEPEPELLRVRTLALWLSRISMPASYALIYALSALLPSLGPIQRCPTWAATMAGSAWLVSRWLAFLVLGFSPWWHTRPRALLGAAWLMLAGFAAVGWEPAALVGATGDQGLIIDMAWLVSCQVVIGFAIGLIYSASLYFGMVLSDGSTEHSGYHEALIGLGSILGPGAGALAQWFRPGEVMPGVVAVSGVLLASTLLASAASVIAGRRRDGPSRAGFPV